MEKTETNKVNEVVIAIDASSTRSGVALFVDGKIQMDYCALIDHRVPTLYQLKKDQLQNTLILTGEMLANKAYYSKPDKIILAIEQPQGSYTSNQTLKQLSKYVGKWESAIMSSLVIFGWDMVNKFEYIKCDSKDWRTKLDLPNRADKQYFMEIAAKRIDKPTDYFNSYDIPIRNIDGTMKRGADNKVLTKTIVADDLAEAILIGYAYSTNYENKEQ